MIEAFFVDVSIENAVMIYPNDTSLRHCRSRAPCMYLS